MNDLQSSKQNSNAFILFFWHYLLVNLLPNSFFVLLMFYEYIDFHMNKIMPSILTIPDKKSSTTF